MNHRNSRDKLRSKIKFEGFLIRTSFLNMKLSFYQKSTIQYNKFTCLYGRMFFSFFFIPKILTISDGYVSLVPVYDDKKDHTYLTALNNYEIYTTYSEEPRNLKSGSLINLEKVKSKKETYRIFFPKFGKYLCRNGENKRVKPCEAEAPPEFIEWLFVKTGDKNYQIRSGNKCLTEDSITGDKKAFNVRMKRCIYKEKGELKKPSRIWLVKEVKNINEEDMKELSDDMKCANSLNSPHGEGCTDKTKKNPNKIGKPITPISVDPSVENLHNPESRNKPILKKEETTVFGPTPEARDYIPPGNGLVQGKSFALRSRMELPDLSRPNWPYLVTLDLPKVIRLWNHSDETPTGSAEFLCQDKLNGDQRTYDYSPTTPYEEAIAARAQKIGSDDGFLEKISNPRIIVDPKPIDMARYMYKEHPVPIDRLLDCTLGNNGCGYLVQR